MTYGSTLQTVGNCCRCSHRRDKRRCAESVFCVGNIAVCIQRRFGGVLLAPALSVRSKQAGELRHDRRLLWRLRQLRRSLLLFHFLFLLFLLLLLLLLS